MRFTPSLVLLAILPSALGHFLLQYPNVPVPFDDDTEGDSPCGGYKLASPLVSLANSTNITVDQFTISLQSTHPQSSWLFRASLTGDNWTNILPVVSQTSIGQFCLPGLKLPSSFAGKTGVIQVIDDAPDGFLYQCAIVNFVSGANTTVGSSCTNATGLTATITNQQSFGNTSATSGTATSSGTAAATSSHSAAVATMQSGGMLSVAFAVIGAVFML